MAVLILGEHDNKTLKLSTQNAVTAATSLTDSDCHLFVGGEDCRAVAEQASKLKNIHKVWLCESPYLAHHLAESMAQVIAPLAQNYTHILAPATTFGKNILPRLAALMGVGQISDVIQIKTPHIFVRPIYAGNAVETVESTDSLKMLTIRPTAFDLAEFLENEQVPIETLDSTAAEQSLSQFIRLEENKTTRPELSSARIVVSGGRGFKNRENFKILEPLAHKLGAAIGASRAAVDAGYISNDSQVGQTGKVVAPELYIAIGISGAIQHLAGMKDSKVIVAINKDPEAPIFKVTDYGLVGDLFKVIPELIEAL